MDEELDDESIESCCSSVTGRVRTPSGMETFVVEAATEQRLVNIKRLENTNSGLIMIVKCCDKLYKSSVNPIIYANTVYSHSNVTIFLELIVIKED